jgi:hypothetical protein
MRRRLTAQVPVAGIAVVAVVDLGLFEVVGELMIVGRLAMGYWL